MASSFCSGRKQTCRLYEGFEFSVRLSGETRYPLQEWVSADSVSELFFGNFRGGDVSGAFRLVLSEGTLDVRAFW